MACKGANFCTQLRLINDTIKVLFFVLSCDGKGCSTALYEYIGIYLKDSTHYVRRIFIFIY